MHRPANIELLSPPPDGEVLHILFAPIQQCKQDGRSGKQSKWNSSTIFVPVFVVIDSYFIPSGERFVSRNNVSFNWEGFWGYSVLKK